jgi:hypothetical protein
MSANTSTTSLGGEHDGGLVNILEKIESQRAVGEYSPASSGTNTRAPSINKLEEGIPSSEPEGPQPITHRPTGFKVPPPDLVVSNKLVVPYNLFDPSRPISIRIR